MYSYITHVHIKWAKSNFLDLFQHTSYIRKSQLQATGQHPLITDHKIIKHICSTAQFKYETYISVGMYIHTYMYICPHLTQVYNYIKEVQNIAWKLLYGTAQFKLDRTRVQYGIDKTRFHFTHVQACVCTQHWRHQTYHTKLLCTR